MPSKCISTEFPEQLLVNPTVKQIGYPQKTDNSFSVCDVCISEQPQLDFASVNIRE